MKAEEYELIKRHVEDQIKMIRTEDIDQERLSELFAELLDYINASKQRVENRIDQELKPVKPYVLECGIMDSREYHMSDEEVFPLVPNDAKEHNLSVEEIRKGMKARVPVKLFTVFLEADHSTTKEFQKPDRLFSCKVISNEWTYSGHCFVKWRKDYYDQLEWLFNMFQRNGREFIYPFTPYLSRFYDVYLLDADFYDIDNIQKIKVDWEEFEEYVKYDLFPVWNVITKRLEAEVKPIPSEGTQLFGNLINYNRLRKDCSYLVAEEREARLETDSNGDLSIISDLENKKNWLMAEFHPKLNKEVKYPLFSVSKASRLRIVTKSDIFAYVEELGFGDQYSLRQIEIKKQTDYAKVTFDIHPYVPDKLPQEKTAKQLWLYFARNGEPRFYDGDALSYLISMVQTECRQYDCVGRFL
ncbi:MAG: hypothetical protein IKH28_09475 [Lachnospiraceae bacterium]|nr:hypothetical protein [Lachnospiraceae bacterium]